DCPITTSGAAPLIVDGFRRVRRRTFTEGVIMERAEYNRHSRARMAETAKTRRNVPRRIARERVPTVPHVAKTRQNVPRRIARERVLERVPASRNGIG